MNKKSLTKSITFLLSIPDQKSLLIYYSFVICLVIVGFYFRFIRWYRFDNLLGDEGVQLVSIDNLVRFGQPILQGEISALDLESKFILYNSTLGLYWLTFIYLLGGASPEGYTYVTFIISCIKIWLLFKTAELAFGKKAGLATLLFGSLAIGEIYNSSWPSQPNNAQFFETASVYLLAHYVKEKKESYFSASVASSLIASQMYPPMYFLLLFKLPYYIKKIFQLQNKVRHLLIALISLVIILIPLMGFELRTSFYNLTTVGSFLVAQEPNNGIFSSSTFGESVSSFLYYLVGTFSILASQYHPLLYHRIGLGVIALFLGSAGYIYFYSTQFTQSQKKLLRYCFTLLVGTILILVFLITLAQSSSHRAYIFIIQPYLLLLIGSVFSTLRRGLYTTGLIIIFITGVLTAHSLSQTSISNPTIHDIRRVSHLIRDDIQQRNISVNSIRVYVISPADEWSWDSSIYWYELSQLRPEQIVTINTISKVQLLHPEKELQAYLICFGPDFTNPENEDICWQTFLLQTYDKYELEKTVTFTTQKVYYVTPRY